MLIVIIILIAMIISVVYGFSQKKYQIDLLGNEDSSKLRKYGVYKLELKRVAKTIYLGSNTRINSTREKRREVSLDAPDQNRIGMYNTVEDWLEVLCYKGAYPHDVYSCPCSQENKEKLLRIVEEYNGRNG